MANISLFYGIVISMRAGSHPKPFFQASYREHRALYDLRGNRASGKMPLAQERLIAAWATIHGDDLEADWRLARSGDTPTPIAPLH